MTHPHADASQPLAARARPFAALGRWPWSATLLRGALAMLALRWLAPHLLPAKAHAAAAQAGWALLGVLVALRWVAGLPEGARRARACGRAWPVRLALLLVPAELPGLLRLALVTADGCLAWATRRVPPPRPEGLRLGDRRKGVYDGFFAMNVISFVVEIPLMALLMSSVAKPWPHVVLHTLEAALVVFVLGDRWWVHAGGHVLTATHLDLCAGARALARVPLAAIASIEPLGKGVTRQAWCRAHGVHPADTGTVSVMDGPNLVLTLQGGVAGTWSRLQVQRPLPRHLFIYLDDPAALAPAVAAAQAAASGS